MSQLSKYDGPNVVQGWINPGLEEWRSRGAEVTFLQPTDSSVQVPRIFAGPLKTRRKGLIIFGTGHHLDEPSGPKFALTPEEFQEYRQTGFGFLIYLINYEGLIYRHDSSSPRLRKNERGINYNSGWGRKRKTKEGRLIEGDVKKVLAKGTRISACWSAHEDSDLPGEGYGYISGITDDEVRRFAQSFSDRWGKKNVACLPSNLERYYKGKVRHGFLWVDTKESDAFEDWLLTKTKAPSFTSEAPFGLNLKKRLSFHREFFRASMDLVSQYS